jgi:amino acid transporter
MVTVVPAGLAAFTGAVPHDELAARYGFGPPWWVYAVAILVSCFCCAYRGIVVSVRALVVLSIFAFTGFESAAAAAFVLADRLWSGGSLMVLIALVDSGLGVCLACTTSSTRTIFGTARTGALPMPLAAASRRFGTPVGAVFLQAVVALAVTLAAGLPLGPYDLFNVLGTTGTFVYVPIFILTNVAAFGFIRRPYPGEFRVLPLVVAPIVSTAALTTIGYRSIVPLPDAPIRFAPAIAAGYLLLGGARRPEPATGTARVDGVCRRAAGHRLRQSATSRRSNATRATTTDDPAAARRAGTRGDRRPQRAAGCLGDDRPS